MKNTVVHLKKALIENGHVLSSERISQLAHYLMLLQKWNEVFNLTAIKNERDAIYLHILDSLTVAPYVKGKHILDVGSGAGLPGIPLVICYPEKEWVLLDKNNKKTRFLIQVIAELKLRHVQVVKARCEDFHPPNCFDSILSRAFGTIKMFAETTQHLLCAQGLLIAMKGKYPQTELDNLKSPFVVKSVDRVEIKGMDAMRHIVCLRKKKE